MTRGKSICKVLRTIRTQVAQANEIKYEPHECHHTGECRGTCPACEAEVRYIEQQLDMRRLLGKAVTLVGISAGLSVLSGCSDKALAAVEPQEQTFKRPEMLLGDVAEQMPMFPGGMQALMDYLKENVTYPKGCEDTCVQGRVILTFAIEKDGSITDAKVVKSIYPALDEEALRVVNAMPKWIPGNLNGEPVRTKYTIPIVFRLQ